MRALIRILLIVLMTGSLSNCEAAGKIAEVIIDPDIQVGDDGDQPTEIALHAYAAEEVNKNFEGEPAPIVVKVFALSSDHRFFSYDFFSLTEYTEDTLGVTLLEELDENMLEPDSYKILGPYELPKRTKRIAVIAEYLDIESATWRTSIKVEDMGADDRLLLLLLDEEARLIKEE